MKCGKRFILMLLTISLAALLLSGCQFNLSFGIGNFIAGESYPNAESYQTGAFSYEADEVQSIEIYWRCGKVNIVETDSSDLRVSESGGELPEKTAMHYLLEDGSLKIRFCESDAKINVSSQDKHLTIEIPKGIDLSVHTTSAPVQADALEQNSVLISVHSGGIRLGAVEAGDVNLSSSSGTIQSDSIMTQALACDASSGAVRIGEVEAETIDVDTSSGSVILGILSAPDVDIHTSSGKTKLRLPEGGGSVSYTSSSGKLHTDVAFERKGDLYVFGNGESRITVDSTSGNLEIQ